MQSEIHHTLPWIPSGLAGLFERPGVYFLTFDTRGNIIEGNATWEERFGRMPADGNRIALIDVVCPESRKEVADILDRLSAGATITGVELCIAPLDGDLFTASGMICPVLDEDAVTSAFGVLREDSPSDFSYRGNQEPTFDVELMTAMVDFAPCGMMIMNDDQDVIAWNRNFLELWGLDASVVHAGHAMTSAARIVANQAEFTETLDTFTGDRELADDGRLRLKDGRVIAWYSVPVWDNGNEYIGRAWYYYDISSRVHAEVELNRSAELYRRLVANLPDGGVCVFGNDLTFIIADGEAVETTGLTRENIEGRRPEEVLPARIHRRIIPMMRAALEGERSQQVVHLYDRGFSIVATPLESVTSESGPHAMLILREITEQEQLQQKLAQAEQRLRTLVEQIPAVTYIQQVRASGNETIYISPQVEEVFGYTPEELLDGSVDWEATIHPDDRDAVLRETEAANQGDGTFSMEYRAIMRDGRERWVRDTASIIVNEHGKGLFWQGILSDITEQRRLESALRASESLFRGAFDDAPNGIVILDLTGTVLRVNRAFCDLVGYEEHELTRPRMIGSLTNPADREEDVRKYRQFINREVDRYRTLKRFIHRDGRLLWTNLDVSYVYGEDGEPEFVLAQVQDITEQQRLEEELRRSEGIFRSAFDHAAIGMARVAPDGRFLDVNAALCQMLGYSRSKLLALDFQEITHPDDLEEDLDLVQKLLDGEITSYNLTKRYIHESGRIVWGDLSVSLVRTEAGHPLFFISQIQDVTQKKDLERQLEFLAHHDQLTGLLNRHGLSRAIDETLIMAPDDPVGVLMLDMDGFKAINDDYGHLMGDEVLCEVADRLQSCVRADDIVARLGGDEFVVVLGRPTDSTRAGVLAARIQAAIERPIELSIGGQDVHIGVSIGVKVGVRARLETELINDADNAMYQAKRVRRSS